MNGLSAPQQHQLRELKDRRQALMHMEASEGWKLFTETFAATEAQAYLEAVKSDNPHVAAKNIGLNYACQSMRSWPQREIAAISVQIEAITNGKS